MIKTFDQLFDQLRTKTKKKLVVAWGVDAHSITAVSKAIEAKELLMQPLLVMQT